MHRSYQPLKPVTNRFLQQRWDQDHYNTHRRKVSSALPVVDTRGGTTPAHIQLKPKKQQLQRERLALIDRDNRLLASRLSAMLRPRGPVDLQHQNHIRSLNADKRRAELQLVARQNQAIYARITSRQSEYRRQLWLDDWERAELRRENISHYPPAAAHTHRSSRKVKFAAVRDRERTTGRNEAHAQESKGRGQGDGV